MLLGGDDGASVSVDSSAVISRANDGSPLFAHVIAVKLVKMAPFSSLLVFSKKNESITTYVILLTGVKINFMRTID
jgi:hypothetical protein